MIGLKKLAGAISALATDRDDEECLGEIGPAEIELCRNTNKNRSNMSVVQFLDVLSNSSSDSGTEHGADGEPRVTPASPEPDRKLPDQNVETTGARDEVQEDNVDGEATDNDQDPAANHAAMPSNFESKARMDDAQTFAHVAAVTRSTQVNDDADACPRMEVPLSQVSQSNISSSVATGAAPKHVQLFTVTSPTNGKPPIVKEPSDFSAAHKFMLQAAPARTLARTESIAAVKAPAMARLRRSGSVDASCPMLGAGTPMESVDHATKARQVRFASALTKEIDVSMEPLERCASDRSYNRAQIASIFLVRSSRSSASPAPSNAASPRATYSTAWRAGGGAASAATSADPGEDRGKRSGARAMSAQSLLGLGAGSVKGGRSARGSFDGAPSPKLVASPVSSASPRTSTASQSHGGPLRAGSLLAPLRREPQFSSPRRGFKSLASPRGARAPAAGCSTPGAPGTSDSTAPPRSVAHHPLKPIALSDMLLRRATSRSTATSSPRSPLCIPNAGQ